ncbi:hypothetical protein QZM05_22595 [Burkholderia multivorans]|nr:hypothetical protein [Burkholderia multivorans]
MSDDRPNIEHPYLSIRLSVECFQFAIRGNAFVERKTDLNLSAIRHDQRPHLDVAARLPLDPPLVGPLDNLLSHIKSGPLEPCNETAALSFGIDTMELDEQDVSTLLASDGINALENHWHGSHDPR